MHYMTYVLRVGVPPASQAMSPMTLFQFAILFFTGCAFALATAMPARWPLR